MGKKTTVIIQRRKQIWRKGQGFSGGEKGKVGRVDEHQKAVDGRSDSVKKEPDWKRLLTKKVVHKKGRCRIKKTKVANPFARVEGETNAD